MSALSHYKELQYSYMRKNNKQNGKPYNLTFSWSGAAIFIANLALFASIYDGYQNRKYIRLAD